MQQRQRFISVLFSFSAIVFIALLGLWGCGEKAPPFDEAKALHPLVSGEKAFQQVKKLVAFGPRPAASDALEASRVYIIDELEKLGWKTSRQTFDTSTPQGSVTFVNLRARFGDSAKSGEAKGLLCSHYDTKRFASFSFVGANDAGSSTGLLIEMARVLATQPHMARKVELVFFDGEEAYGTRITDEDGLFGSKYYATQMNQLPKSKRPQWGVLLDMVGDKDLNVRAAIKIPGASIQSLRESGSDVDIQEIQGAVDVIAQDLLSAATDLDSRSKIGISSDLIVDDHVPLNTIAGIPTIDIIDFDYGNYWHTPADTLDKISAESLETVGKVSMLLIEKYLLPRGGNFD